MSIEEAKTAIVEELLMYDDWLDRYEYIISLGKDLPGLTDDRKTDDRLIKGCQSRVWLDSRREGSRLFFDADSDALITRGIIAMLIRVYSGQEAAEIASDDFLFVKRTGLVDNLSPTRTNGLASMISTIRGIAAEAAGEDGGR